IQKQNKSSHKKTIMKRIINSILSFIKRLLAGLPAILKKAVGVGVTITNAIKNFDDKNPSVADILTAIIPGTLDDTIKDKLRAALPKIVVELRLVQATEGLTDPNEIMLAA